jgi:hypothetical protein
MDQVDIQNIAIVCHEANRAYCQTIADAVETQLPWDEAPDWQRDSAIMGVQFHLSGDRTPEESHESWLAQKLADGWQYGPVKDPANKIHPCMVPYHLLPAYQRLKDKLFGAIVGVFKEPEEQRFRITSPKEPPNLADRAIELLVSIDARLKAFSEMPIAEDFNLVITQLEHIKANTNRVGW